jgi:predicted DCC family thiol-disulfide oxidoreductase YuxK
MRDIENHSIILFDGVCNLCSSIVRFIIKRDTQKKFLFAALQSESGQQMLKKYGLPKSEFNSFVLIKDDKCYQKSAAGIILLHNMGGCWKFFYAFKYIPEPVRDFFYDLVARYRYSVFGKKDACVIPDKDLISRFL